MREMWADGSSGGVEDFCAAKAAMVSKATTANRRERARFIVEASWAEIVAYRQPGSGKPGQARRWRENGELAKSVDSRAGGGGWAPLPLFSQVFILKGLKVICFDTLLQVFILKVVSQDVECSPFQLE